jgi:hypothetical protein
MKTKVLDVILVLAGAGSVAIPSLRHDYGLVAVAV